MRSSFQRVTLGIPGVLNKEERKSSTKLHVCDEEGVTVTYMVSVIPVGQQAFRKTKSLLKRITHSVQTLRSMILVIFFLK